VTTQGPTPSSVSGNTRDGCRFNNIRSCFWSGRIFACAGLHLKKGLIWSENRSMRPKSHVGSSPKFGSHEERTYRCGLSGFGPGLLLSSPLKITLVQKSCRRCQRDVEISPVVLGGVKINFLPRARRALASGGGAFIWCKVMEGHI
jgi:hypothetical protein